MSTTFTAGFDQANADFAAIDGETFKVVKNGKIGIYSSMTINDLAFSTKVAPGGSASENTLILWISKAVMEEADIVQGTILVAREHRVRVRETKDDGHNTVSVQCIAATGSL